MLGRTLFLVLRFLGELKARVLWEDQSQFAPKLTLLLSTAREIHIVGFANARALGLR